jgi:glutamine phosphoribosylpyrophosphate amidotransferase
LTVDGLVNATGRQRGDFCLGCLTGKYPSTPAFSLPDDDRQPALR